MVLSAIYLAGLIKLAAGYADVLVFCFLGDRDQLLRCQRDAVHRTKSRQKRNDHGRGRGETADRKLSVYHRTKACSQIVSGMQRNGGTPELICPIPLRLVGCRGNVPLCPLVKLQGLDLDHAVLLRTVGDVNALVDGKSRDHAKLMIGMCTDGTDAVWRKRYVLRCFFVCLFKCFVCGHTIPPLISDIFSIWYRSRLFTCFDKTRDTTLRTCEVRREARWMA